MANGEGSAKKSKKKKSLGSHGGQRIPLENEWIKREAREAREAAHAAELECVAVHFATLTERSNDGALRVSGPWRIPLLIPEVCALLYPEQTAEKFPDLPLSTKLSRSRFRRWYRTCTRPSELSKCNYLTHEMFPASRTPHDGWIPNSIREKHVLMSAADDRREASWGMGGQLGDGTRVRRSVL